MAWALCVFVALGIGAGMVAALVYAVMLGILRRLP